MRRHPRIRVLHLIKCLGFGGAERLLVSVAQARDQERFDYEVAYVMDALHDLAGELEAEGVPVHSLRCTSHFDLRWLPLLRRLVVDRGYDVVHLHLPYSAALGRLVVRTVPAAKRPAVVYTQHNLWGKTEPAVRLLNRATIHLDDRDLAVSEVARASMPRLVRGRVDVVVHGIQLGEAEYARAARDGVRRSLGLAPGDVAVITVANFRPEKGYAVLISAASRLIGEGLPVRFFAVGAGPLDGEVRRMCDDAGVGDRFRLLGFRADVASLLAAADVFVLASLHEAFPVSVMEALAAGLPVVATDVGAVSEALGHGLAGITVAPGDASGLTEALRALVVDAPRRAALQRESLRRGANYDIRNTVARIEGIYAGLAGSQVTVG